jgi:hypothetical protein
MPAVQPFNGVSVFPRLRIFLLFLKPCTVLFFIPRTWPSSFPAWSTRRPSWGGSADPLYTAGTPATLLVSAVSHQPNLYGCTVLLVEMAESADRECAENRTDPHSDSAMLLYLKDGQAGEGLAVTELRRILKRVTSYRLQNGTLLRIMANPVTRVVPAPARRRAIIEDTHKRLGHFGTRRTLGLLQTGFWWPGMSRDVIAVVVSFMQAV